MHETRCTLLHWARSTALGSACSLLTSEGGPSWWHCMPMGSLLRRPLLTGGNAPRRWLVCLLAFSLVAVGLTGLVLPQAQAQGEVVYLAEVKGEIDLGLAPYLGRVLRKADADGVAAVVLDINTPGGRLDAALEMKNALLESKVPTIAFVNREAFSAGALIAIATERIYMAPGAVLGAATPVLGDSGETASEKVVSAVRKVFGSVAETRGLDPQVAEAMVDPDVEVPGLVESGKLLTLTTADALQWGYAKAEVENLDALLEQEGLAGGSVVAIDVGIAERLVRFITNPIVSSMLVALGFLGIFFELQSPSFGVSGVLGATFLALFFWGHFLAGLAGLEGIILVVAGLALLGLEVLVIPGFGVAGILGISAFLAGLFLTMIGEIPTSDDYQRSLLTVVSALMLMLVGGFLSLRFLPKRSFGGLVLQARLAGAMGAVRGRLGQGDARGAGAEDGGSLEGAPGTTVTPLRPAGTAMFVSRRVDVFTEGDFIPAGTAVVVVLHEEYRTVVRAVTPPGEEEGPDAG